MGKEWILIVLIFLSLVIIGTFTFPILFGDDGLMPPNPTSESNQPILDESEQVEEAQNTDSSTESTGSAGSSGAGSSSGSSSSSSGSSSESSQGSQSGSLCQLNQISYSINGFVVNTVCNEFENSICIDKTVDCSLEVRNLDNEVSGSFEVEFVFFETGTGTTNPFETNLVEHTISPNSNQTFTDTFNIQSQGEQGTANLDLTCFYNTISIPKKEVCF